MSWRRIAALPQYAPIPAGTLCRWYHTGYLPPKWYHRLGIEPPVTVYPCAKCGQVHPVTKCCPSTNGHKKRQRIAISKLDPHSAARSILANCQYGIAELTEQLERVNKELR